MIDKKWIEKNVGNFTHVHCHSCYSLKDGSISIRDMVDRQVENGSRAVAITDHGMMTGGWFLYDYIHNVAGLSGVKHIIGCELYWGEHRDELMSWLPDSKTLEPDKELRAEKRKRLAKKYHQIVLAKNQIGYYNAIKIHNDAWENGFYYSPTTTKDIIFSNAEGLIATTTCLASIWCQAIMQGNIGKAEKEIMEWKEAFGDDFFVELQPTNSKTQVMVNRELIRLAKKTNTRMIITNDVHYLDKEDHELHYTLLNLSALKQDAADGGDSKKWEFDVTDLYMKSLGDMQTSWKQHHKSKEFTESVFESTIYAIGDIIDSVDHYSLECEPLLPSVDDEDPLVKLKRNVVAGLALKVEKGLIPASKLAEYEDRIITELEVISALNAENYINLCHFITSWCKDNSIEVGVGRGSAPASLVLYLLGVTGLDPIHHKLIFQRFLNRNRRSKLLM